MYDHLGEQEEATIDGFATPRIKQYYQSKSVTKRYSTSEIIFIKNRIIMRLSFDLASECGIIKV